MSYRGLIK